MSANEVLIDLIGGVALMLWALRMVRTGVMRSFGSNLRGWLGSAMRNRLSAFGAGLGATVLLQSSTATGLLAGSFAGRGLIATAPALAVMLGADVGSALVVQVLSFGFRSLGPLLIAIGVIMFLASPSGQRRDIGRCLVGGGLLLLALRMLVGASESMRQAIPLHDVLALLGNAPLLAVLIAAALTWLAHSSLAMVVLVASLAQSQVVDRDVALLLVLGINVGGAFAPFIASLSAPIAARRVPLGNFLFKAAGCLVAMPLVGLIVPVLSNLGGEPARLVANFHLAFNLALAVVFIGLTDAMARLTAWLLPDPGGTADEAAPRYLDDSLIEAPSVALSFAARETLRMADTVEAMLRGTLEVLRIDDRRRVAEIRRKDDIIDSLHEAIKLYLTQLTRGEPLSATDAQRWGEIMGFATNLEHIGDIIDKNLMEMCGARIKNGHALSAEGMAEITEMHGRMLENLRLATTVFMSGDRKVAQQLVEHKRAFRDQERSLVDSHLARLRQGKVRSIETSGLHIDVLRDFKRINSHITAAAYSVLAEPREVAADELRLVAE